MRGKQISWAVAAVLVGAAVFGLAGCNSTPVDTSEYVQGPAPARFPSPGRDPATASSYEDSLTGAQVFSMYCSSCHNAPSLAERNFANFQNVANHMRLRANLTGKEYARLIEFLRRWHDVPPPNAGVDAPSPKRLMFSQPVAELRDEGKAPAAAAAPAKE